MTVTETIKLAGGQTVVARLLGVKRQAVHKWCNAGRLPMSEWTGRTRYAEKIANLAQLLGHDLSPLDICPMAGQYMVEADSEVDA